MQFKLMKSVVAVALGATIASTAMSEAPPQVGSSRDSSHVFLNFQSGKSLAENPTTAANYMKAIDPQGKKINFVDWLVNAGFISQASDWNPSGQQTYTRIPGDYGYGKVNAFAHIIILNSADLGFIRNQYIRCVPDCKTRNAKIFTYLENYDADQFDDVNQTDEINTPRAVSIALEKRPVTGKGQRIADVAFEFAPAANGSNPTHNFGQIYAYVIVPEVDSASCNTATRQLTLGNPIPDPNHPGTQKVDEQYVWPAGVNGVNQAIWDCKFNTRPASIPATSDQSPDATHVFFRNPPPPFLIKNGDVFAPELDGLGTKQNPGVCLVCHGGNIPSTLATTQSWGPTGEINEFRMLPADAVNSIFGINDTGHAVVIGASGSDATEFGQAVETKKYAQAVALSHGAVPAKTATFASDGSITGQWNVGKSPDHALQAMFGWYQAFEGDYSMSAASPLQNRSFVPVGWRTGPGGTNQLYSQVIQRECRSCHLNREASLDFRTQAQFDANKGNVQDFVFQPECDFLHRQVNPNNVTMPLARLTWERLWNGIFGDPGAAEVYLLPPESANNGVIDNRTLFGFGPAGAPNTIGPGTVSKSAADSDINLLKAHFGYTQTSYCATKH